MSELKRKSLCDEVYDILVSQILREDYKTGEKIQIDRIAKDIGVSRTPVISALQRMVYEGFLESRPNYGFYIPKFERRDIEESALALTELNKSACFYVLQHTTRVEVTHLRKLAQETLSPDLKFEEYMNKDFEFHDYLVSLMNNKWYSNFHGTLFRQSYLWRSISEEQTSPRILLAKQHLELCDAIETRDRAKVQKVLDEHNGLSYALKSF